MKRDEILKMAEEAGGIQWGWESVEDAAPMFERFAALVAAKEREACALALEALIADHVTGTRKSPTPEDWCAADDNSCEYVVAWADGAEAIRKRGAA